jgi:hypothetical protein
MASATLHAADPTTVAVPSEAAGIVLAKLPPALRAALAPLDIDGSGELSADEIGAAVATHVSSLAEAKAHTAKLLRLLSLLAAAFVFLCGAMAVVVYLVVGARVSAPASASAYAAAGVMPLLSTSGAPVHVRSTRALATVSLTAASADADLSKLVSVMLSPADAASTASATFPVNGWARTSPSLVVLFTPVRAFPYVTLDAAGSFTLISAALNFNTSTPEGATSAAISQALGLTSGSGRRLVKRSSAKVVADL